MRITKIATRLLWQVSVIGMLGHEKTYYNQKGLELLYTYLNKYYSLDHELISYSAAQYPGLDPIIQKFELGRLLSMTFSRVTTLYIPPLKKVLDDKKMLAELKLI